uniref:Uncharacterized protein n=1 Tax=Rhizophora mucronata TaxID=61149 RepID=A0A2P2QU79_RHIMU
MVVAMLLISNSRLVAFEWLMTHLLPRYWVKVKVTNSV